MKVLGLPLEGPFLSLKNIGVSVHLKNEDDIFDIRDELSAYNIPNSELEFADGSGYYINIALNQYVGDFDSKTSDALGTILSKHAKKIEIRIDND